MLVLTRKLGEGIAIGEDIKVVVMQIKGKQVRLGIKADPTTAVHREEVYQKIREENKLASENDVRLMDEVAKVVQSENKQLKSPFRTKKKENR